LGRFVQPDTIVPNPGDPQALNRYSYALNNSLKYTDPTGHNAACASLMGGGPLGGIAALVCEVGSVVASYWPQVQALAVQAQQLAPFAAELPAATDRNLNPQPAQPSDNAGNTAPGNLDPNNWDPSRLQFKSNSSLRSHFERHVLDKPKEAWEEVLGVTRGELETARGDPGQLTRLQDAYVRIGQQTASVDNYVGVQAQGQRVFVDASKRIVSIVQGDRLQTLYRITEWIEFSHSIESRGLQFAPGINLEILRQAMGF
jgi:hypothetical protein